MTFSVEICLENNFLYNPGTLLIFILWSFDIDFLLLIKDKP
jgi:hypothetical protein